MASLSARCYVLSALGLIACSHGDKGKDDDMGASTGDMAAPSTAGLTKVGTGEYETFYLKDGTIYAYGGGGATLGLGTYQGVSIPPHPIATPSGLTFLDVQGGLHQSMAIDQNHRAWTWGDTSVGLQGSGTTGGDPTTPYMVTTDVKGATFDNIVAIQPTQYFNAALKGDGTVWVWGKCVGGITGDGTAGAEVDKPQQVPLPAGVKITKIAGAVAMLALDSNGNVWSWGPAEGNILGTGNVADGSGNTPAKVVGLPANIQDITAGGSDFFYALTTDGELYAWGYRNPYFGIPGYAPVATPMSMKTVLNLPMPVKQVVADSLTTHAILSDGTLWGWGDAACGGVGNGEEPDWSTKGCGWDFMSYDDMVYAPVQIVPSVSNFKQIFANSAYDFYVYAITEDGVLYSWGRNKTGTLGNGVYPGPGDNVGVAADVAANHPNSWDVATATAVTPFTTPAAPTLSSCCPAGDVDAGGCM